jgi:hypothetical protein
MQLVEKRRRWILENRGKDFKLSSVKIKPAHHHHHSIEEKFTKFCFKGKFHNPFEKHFHI